MQALTLPLLLPLCLLPGEKQELTFWEWPRIAGEWGGLRGKLEEAGVTVGGSWTFDRSRVGRGGTSSDKEATRSLLDVNLGLDLGTLAGADGLTAFMDIYAFHGQNGSDLVGDFQAFSNIDTDRADFIMGEAWLQQMFFEEKLRVKFGKIDSNAEFGQPISGGDFIHSSSAFPATASEMPFYPNPSGGVLAFVYPTEGLYFGAGWFDGEGFLGKRTGLRGIGTFFDNEDGVNNYFGIAELGYSWPNSSALGWGRAVAGIWMHTGDFTRFDASVDRGTLGHYFILEQRVWKRVEDDDTDERGIRAFAQYSWSDPRTHALNTHWGAGLVMNGTFNDRPDDATGIYLSLADFSDINGANDGAGNAFFGNETAMEIFYKIQLTPAIVLRPDFQYIWNPSGALANTAANNDTLVGTIRIEITF